jgi:hypothetical protein
MNPCSPPIKVWHVIISGFLQHEGQPTGMAPLRALSDTPQDRDFLIGWAALYAAVALRRQVNFSLDAASVILFALSLIVALSLSGFYRDRVTPRPRPPSAPARPAQYTER